MPELDRLEKKLVELEGTIADVRRDVDLARKDEPDEDPQDIQPPLQPPPRTRRSTPETAEDEATLDVLSRLHTLGADTPEFAVRPIVPADSRGLLRAVEDLKEDEFEVVIRCGSDAEGVAGTITSLLESTTRRFSLSLELVPGAPREIVDYAERLTRAFPVVTARPGPGEVAAPELTARRTPGRFTVSLRSAMVVADGWMELLHADLQRAGVDAAVARTASDADADGWLGRVGAPSWASAADLAPLALSHAPAPGQGSVPFDGCVLLGPGVDRPESWVRSRALSAVYRQELPAPSVLDARAHCARLGVALKAPLRVAFVIGGVPAGGAGGTHSIYQETVGLRGLGADACILLPADRLAHAISVYPAAGEDVFRPFSDPADLERQANEVDVVVATEFPTVRLCETLAPAGLLAYYLQDYEPLFAPPGSRAGDEALLSLGALPDALLFTKTRWLRDLIQSAHGVRVAKVEPSLDANLFHEPQIAPISERHALRVAAMVRPRTIRRRPAATVRALERLRGTLGERVHVVGFGCTAEELQEFLGRVPAGVEHRGILSRDDVSALLQSSDVFLDLSVYQAFGRSGLEAMACGCVPVLPELGGAAEYARDGRNAILLDVTDEDAVIMAVERLSGDGRVLHELREEGVRGARRFSIERAALSLYALFAQRLLLR